MTRRKFTKMHALGNDFIVVNALNEDFNPEKEVLQQLADRHTGIGFDQCLVVRPSSKDGIDFFYQIFNASGDEVGQCGNGARCLMRYLLDKKITDKSSMTIATKTTVMRLHLTKNNDITIDFEIPRFLPKDIPFITDESKEPYTLLLKNNLPVTFYTVNVGNPHAIIFVDDINTADVAGIGAALCTHPDFPEGVNVNFVQLLDKENMLLRVFERGVGETLACGSGAVASMAICKKIHHAASSMQIHLTLGSLTVTWLDDEQPIQLTGNATFVFDGELYSCASSF